MSEDYQLTGRAKLVAENLPLKVLTCLAHHKASSAYNSLNNIMEI